jgi:hypothetical protein
MAIYTLHTVESIYITQSTGDFLPYVIFTVGLQTGVSTAHMTTHNSAGETGSCKMRVYECAVWSEQLVNHAVHAGK